ncbi:MAG TPA: PHP domain-containing protein [Candidatus Humimicrobiaceae bacterium]|nr:PHP domain-containing protein [Candidatus Humimicrobiaceae bacterium]
MKCDLHCHTGYSYDSTAEPEEMIEAALQKGINCLAICDHGEIKGAQKAIEYAKDKPILIIPGIEIKSKEGDILGLNIKEVIPNKLSASETIKKIKGLGGLVVIPHPFGWSCSFRGNLEDLISKIDWSEELRSSRAEPSDNWAKREKKTRFSATASAGALAIEILNASIFGRGNKKALIFSQKYNLSVTAGSDAHFPNFVGRVYLEIPGDNLSVEEVLNQIKKGAAKIHGREADCLEKAVDHVKRNIARLKNLI